MFKLAVFAVLGLAAAQVPEGSYPSLTPAQIAEEYPKIDGQYIVVFNANQQESLLSTHMDTVKALGTVHREYHIAAPDTAKSFRGYHVTLTDEAHVKTLEAMPEVKYVEQNGIAKAQRLSSKPHKADCSMQAGATWGITRVSELNNDKVVLQKRDPTFFHAC